MFREADEAHRRLTEQLAKEVKDPHRFLELARNIVFRSSARNQFFATVQSVPPEPGLTLLPLELGEDIVLRASVTREAIDALELASGSTVMALIKASAITVCKPAPIGVSAGPFNVMKGRVLSRADQGLAPQFRVAVTDHLTVWGIGETGSRLQPGDTAQCAIPWAAVLIVLPSEPK